MVIPNNETNKKGRPKNMSRSKNERAGLGRDGARRLLDAILDEPGRTPEDEAERVELVRLLAARGLVKP